jgi:arylsulfatase A-like enzyme
MAHKRQTRRTFVKQMSLGLGAVALTGNLSSCKTSKARPNILFIMSDDHAAQAISCYGSRINQTPNIDRIAREGMRFDNCFCTNGICAPSRAVILTGKHSHVNGVLDNRLEFDSSQQTFPKLLQQAGYTTAMIGKWHLKSDPTGFDYWNILPGQGYYYNPEFIEMGEKKQHIGYATDITTDFCLQWLEQRDKTKPFCLMYHHKAPHRNWMPGPKHLTMFDDIDIPEPDNLFDTYETRCDAAREQEMTIANHMYPAYDLKLTPPEEKNVQDKKFWDWIYGRLTTEQRAAWESAYGPKNEKFRKAQLKGEELTRWKYQRYIKDYLRCIASVDENIGRVLTYLDDSKLTENTIIIYTSDQGFYLGEHGWFDKRFMYEESLRMPLVMRFPDEISAGSVNKDIVQNLDFAPTFLNLAGITLPEDMQGRSLRKLIQGRTPPDWRQSAYYHYFEYPAVHAVKRHYGIRTKRYKLMHFYYDIDAWELYDLEQDPNEMNNVYNQAAYASTIKELKVQLQELRQYYGDTDYKKFLPENKS